MRLTCKVCQEQLIVPEPEGTEVSYGVQEFVKIHAHVGGHEAMKQTQDLVQSKDGLIPLSYYTFVPWDYNSYRPASLDIKRKDKPLKSWTGRKFR
jgi:hypothetical protein